MAFIMFETGSAKWVRSESGFPRRISFVSDFTQATPYSDIWSLEGAAKNAGVDKYLETLVMHDLNGKPK